jgi:hypothetical protein
MSDQSAKPMASVQHTVGFRLVGISSTLQEEKRNLDILVVNGRMQSRNAVL